MFPLKGKTALGTGASRGIGKAIAKAFAGVGADPLSVRRNSKSLGNVSKEISKVGRKALPIVADIGIADEIKKAVDEALLVFPRIDILVNNAGISPALKRAEELSLHEWKEILRVNLTGTFLFCQTVARVMIRRRGQDY